jgi:hypothetical protein
VIPNRDQLVRAYVLSAIVVLVAALGSLLYAETASVKLALLPHKLTVNTTLTNLDLHTQPIDATVKMAQRGTASTVQTQPTYATGKVVFSCTTPRCPSQLRLPAATLVATSKTLGYTTVSPVTLTRARSATVDVRATAPGAAWNTGPNTITEIYNAEQYPIDLHVTNPASVDGALNSRAIQVILQSDVDALNTQLSVKATNALNAALRAKALQMSYAAIGLPVMAATTDRRVGDLAPFFTMTMTGSLGATAFSDDEAQSLMKAALVAKVPRGQALTDGPIISSYEVRHVGPNGQLTLSGTSTALVIPDVSSQTLRTQIRGLSPAAARKSLEGAAPGSKIEIQISPVELPLLPLIKEHITVKVTVQY